MFGQPGPHPVEQETMRRLGNLGLDFNPYLMTSPNIFSVESLAEREGEVLEEEENWD